MTTRRLLGLSVLSLGLAVAACGKGDSTTQPVADHLARLVPADAFVFVHVANPKALEGEARALVASVDPKSAGDIRIDKVVADMFGPAAAHVDLTKPLGIAVSLAPNQKDEPLPTFVFAVTDVEAFKKAMSGGRGTPPLAFSGSYVAISQVPGHQAGDVPAIAKTTPAGDVGARVDLAQLVSRFGPQIEEGLNELSARAMNQPRQPGVPDLSGMLEGIQGFAKQFLDSAETLELGASIEGTRVDLALKFTAKAGSALAKATPASAELAALAGHLPDAPLYVLLSMDWNELMDAFQPFMESMTASMPPAMQESFGRQMKVGREFYPLMGREMAVSMAAPKDGLAFVMVANAKDANAYLAKMDEMWSTDLLTGAADMGVTMSKGETATVSGVSVRSYRMDFDFEKLMANRSGGRDLPPEAKAMADKMLSTLFGKEGVVVRVAAVGNRIAMTFGGGQEAIAKVIASLASGKGKTPPALAAAIDKAGGKPSFLVNVEVRALVGQILDLARAAAPPKEASDIPTVPAGGPIPILLFGTGDGRVYSGGLSLEMGELARLVEVFAKPGRRPR
jgi:hypothetical protein